MSEKLAASGIILAGGRSSRIGRDKGRLAIGGIDIAQRAVDLIEAIFSEVVFVTNQPRSVPWTEDLVIVEDEIPYQGPLGGISAGLQRSEHFINFVVAVDMPFLSESLIRFLIEAADEADVVVPQVAGRYEPLHAVYSKNCLSAIRTRLKKGDFRTVSFFDEVNVAVVGEDKLRHYDPELLAFFNINTWDDYRKAEEIYRRRGRE